MVWDGGVYGHKQDHTVILTDLDKLYISMTKSMLKQSHYPYAPDEANVSGP